MEPLYRLAEKNQLGILQLMDEATVNWLKDNTLNYSLGSKTILDLFPYFSPIKSKFLERFIPKNEWFLKKEHVFSIHGLKHIIRVLIYSGVISQLEFGKTEKALLYSACIHDLRRITDKGDSGHGSRASVWFRRNQKKLFPNLSAEEIERISQICKFHGLPETNEKENKYVWLFKAADALDRFRLPKLEWWPNEKFFRNKNAVKLIPLARDFTLKSEALYLRGGLSQKRSVFDIAKQLCLIE